MAGRKKIEINKDQFEDLLQLQCTKEDIAGFFHCSHDTIERFCKRTYGETFSEVAEEYHAEGRCSIRRAQFAMMNSGDSRMAIHLGKQYLGQTDKTEAKVTADVTAKHGRVTRIIMYDHETGRPTKEALEGIDEDVQAFIRDRDNYNGDTVTVQLPVKDPDPDEDEPIEGERIITSADGQTRLHLPIGQMDDVLRGSVRRMVQNISDEVNG